MSARAWKRRRAKATARDPDVRQWFLNFGDKLASELAENRGDIPLFSWRLSLHGLTVYQAHDGPTTAPPTEKTEPTSGLEPETC